MKQPLFKFGDKLQPTDNDPAFIVDKIDYIILNNDGTGEYQYNGKFWESETILYQETKKKKLYAYGAEKHFKIEFFDRELFQDSVLIRKPEYDIEYPETIEEVFK